MAREKASGKKKPAKFYRKRKSKHRLGPNRAKTKSKKENGLRKKKNLNLDEKDEREKPPTNNVIATSQLLPPSEQRDFFLGQFQSANGIKLSSLELEFIKDAYFLKLEDGVSQDASNLGKHVKHVFSSSWKEVLCEGQIIEEKVDPGSPAVLVVSASAIRSLELLRGLRMLTKDCKAVKLFSKHMKVDEQVALLKNRVNIACGTPSRIKKLCEMEALGLSRLELLVLDMHTDVKGYSLFTLPQVRDEFWDLYRSYFHQRLVQGNLRFCLYGPIPKGSRMSNKTSEDE